VLKPCNNLYVPNVFTPNNDGINDDLVISLQGNPENPQSNNLDTLSPSGEPSVWSNFTFYSINVFDRWGREVYSSNSPTAYWNGRISNTQDLVPEGVYYYVIKTTCGGSNNEKKGFVQVLGEK
jgi:gliding motility-associated-like protein